MPLSHPPPGRERLHVREVAYHGYQRADGLYDIEIFSDDGTFGSELEGSYWAAPPEETLARAVAAFERCWAMACTPQEVEETR